MYKSHEKPVQICALKCWGSIAPFLFLLSKANDLKTLLNLVTRWVGKYVVQIVSIHISSVCTIQ